MVVRSREASCRTDSDPARKGKRDVDSEFRQTEPCFGIFKVCSISQSDATRRQLVRMLWTRFFRPRSRHGHRSDRFLFQAFANLPVVCRLSVRKRRPACKGSAADPFECRSRRRRSRTRRLPRSRWLSRCRAAFRQRLGCAPGIAHTSRGVPPAHVARTRPSVESRFRSRGRKPRTATKRVLEASFPA